MTTRGEDADKTGVFLSPEHIRYLEEQLSLGVWLWTLEGDRLSWSEGLYRILGLSPETVSPSFELYRSVVHPDDQLDFSDRQAVATTGKLAHRKFRIIRPNGEMRWVESHGRLLFGPDGEPSRMVGFARDITDIKAATDVYAAHRAAMRAVGELTGARLWRVANDGTVVDGADWWQMVDRSRAGSRFSSRVAHIHPDDLAREQAAWAQAEDEFGIYRGTYRAKQPDGSYSTISSVALPIKTEEGEPIGWISVSKPADLPALVRYLAADEVPAALFRAARGYLDMAGEAFAAQVGVSYSTIRRLEGSDGAGSKVGFAVRQQVVDFLARHGVRFTTDSAGLPQLSITPSYISQLIPEGRGTRD